MKQIFTILVLILITNFSSSQDLTRSKYGTGFNSIFQKFASGEFKGTVNGLLIIRDTNSEESILDFQGSDCSLSIKHDPYEIYDVSTKIYRGTTTSEKTEIEYKTYFWSNAFTINLNAIMYEINIIDGDCSNVINGLDYEYRTDTSTEYMILQFTSEVTLSNWSFLIKEKTKMSPEIVNRLKQKEEMIKILPKSVLVFAIKKP